MNLAFEEATKVALLKVCVWAKEASTRIGNHYGGHSKGNQGQTDFGLDSLV